MRLIALWKIFLLTLSVLTISVHAQAEGLFGPPAPGSAGGTGSVFSVIDSNYKNVTVTVSTEVNLYVSSMVGAIDINLEAIGVVGEAVVSVAGLASSTEYYVYLDSYTNESVITTDGNGSLSLPFDLSEARHVMIQEYASTLFISDSAWVDNQGINHVAGWTDSDGNDLNHIPGVQNGVGTWDPLTRTATLVTDVNDTIEILSDNIILDGDGYTVDGTIPDSTSRRRGINTRYRYDLTIKNINFYNCSYTIYLYGGRRFNILDNVITQGVYGVYLQWGAGSAIVENNYIANEYGAISLNLASGGNIIRNNEVTGNRVATHILAWSGSSDFEDNIYSNNETAFQIYGDNSLFKGNTLSYNQTAVIFQPNYYSPDRNTFFNNNFLNNVTNVSVAGVDNVFNLPLPDGGNHWSDWTTPDSDGDGIVDVPYPIHDVDGIQQAQDDYPWTTQDGWIVNQAPVFEHIGPQEIIEYDVLEFTLIATDPEGDQVSLYAGDLPLGASFDPDSGLFSWQPVGNQSGVYTVSFFAEDNGNPPAVGQIDVVITVGEVESPTSLTDILTEDIADNETLPPEALNSYDANLKKVNVFIQDGKVTAAVNQLEAFIKKIQQDVEHGVITQADGDFYIMIAQDIIVLLTSS